jgi:hypothetical protein
MQAEGMGRMSPILTHLAYITSMSVIALVLLVLRAGL